MRISLLGGFISASILLIPVSVAAESNSEEPEPVYQFEAFDNSQESLNSGIDRKDLAFHPGDSFFFGENQFYLLQLENGYIIFIGFYSTKIGIAGKQGVNITAVTPGGHRSFEKQEFKASDFTASSDSFEIVAGKNYARGAAPDYTIHIEGKSIYLHAEISDLAPGWNPGSGRIYFGDKRESFYDLSVTNPRAVVQATVRIDNGGESSSKGFLYGSHVYTNMLTTKQAVSWCNLRYAGEKYSVNFMEFITPEKYGGKHLPWLMITDNEKILYATMDVTASQTDPEIDQATGFSYAKQLDISVWEEGFILDGSVKMSTLCERLDIFAEYSGGVVFIAKQFFKRPVVFRMKGECRIDFRINPGNGGKELSESISGACIYEHVFVN